MDNKVKINKDVYEKILARSGQRNKDVQYKTKLDRRTIQKINKGEKMNLSSAERIAKEIINMVSIK